MLHKTMAFRDSSFRSLIDLLNQQRFPKGSTIHLYGTTKDEALTLAIENAQNSERGRYKILASNYDLTGVDSFGGNHVEITYKAWRRMEPKAREYFNEMPRAGSRGARVEISDKAHSLLSESVTFEEASVDIIADLAEKLRDPDFRSHPQVVVFRNSAYLLDDDPTGVQRSLFQAITHDLSHDDVESIDAAIDKNCERFVNLRRLGSELDKLPQGSIVAIGRLPQERLLSRLVLPKAGYEPSEAGGAPLFWKEHSGANDEQLFIKQR